jgi:hypothetical protein
VIDDEKEVGDGKEQGWSSYVTGMQSVELISAVLPLVPQSFSRSLHSCFLFIFELIPALLCIGRR